MADPLGTPRRTDVAIPFGPATIAAWFYPSPTPGSRNCIILGHGLGAVREMGLDRYAATFQEAGYSCIAFDYRGFGSSSGSARQILNWERQQQDWHAVIAWARERPDIDAEKIGLFGTSFGGGHVISIAAKDKRIAAAISQCPFTHGISSALTVGYWVGLKLGLLAAQDLLVGTEDNFVAVNLVGKPGEVALMNAPDVMAGYHRLAPASLRGRFLETVAARVVLEFLYNSPGWYAREVDCPIFFAVCGQDSVAPPGATLAYAKEAKRGVVKQYHEMSHFTIYHDEHFKTATADYLNFLADVLPIAI